VSITSAFTQGAIDAAIAAVTEATDGVVVRTWAMSAALMMLRNDVMPRVCGGCGGGDGWGGGNGSGGGGDGSREGVCEGLGGDGVAARAGDVGGGCEVEAAPSSLSLPAVAKTPAPTPTAIPTKQRALLTPSSIRRWRRLSCRRCGSLGFCGDATLRYLDERRRGTVCVISNDSSLIVIVAPGITCAPR